MPINLNTMAKKITKIQKGDESRYRDSIAQIKEHLSEALMYLSIEYVDNQDGFDDLMQKYYDRAVKKGLLK